MTTPSDVALPANDIVPPIEHRLHPWSWLFVLIQQLKSFALPLLVLLFTGRGNSYELWGLLGAGVLVLYSLAQYFTYRYRFDADGLVIRSGVLQRSLRHIPYDRIHNVGLHQSLLHRLFKVAEVRLESAGGAKPEGRMQVLSLDASQRLEQQIRHHGRAPAATAEQSAELAAPLLALDTGEVIRLGLVSNRGLIVVAAGVGALASIGGDVFRLLIDRIQLLSLLQALAEWGEARGLGYAAAILGAGLLFLLAALALRLLSVLLALLQYHGFELREFGQRLSAQRGLLSRLRSSLPRHRIQSWSLKEGLLHRWLGRQSLRVDSVAVDAAQHDAHLRQLAPVATPAAVAGLIEHLLPSTHWPLRAWRPLHPRAWRRQFTLPAVLLLLASAVLVWRFQLPGLLSLLLLPLLWLRARVWAAHAAYAEEAGLIAVREGWLDRHWRFAEVRKLQAVRLSQSPFDRRHGMASLHLDTAGAHPMEPPLRIRYLPEPEARALCERLLQAITPARTVASAAPAR